MTEQDRRILSFLLSHGLISAEKLQKELRRRIELETARFTADSAGRSRPPSRWSLHRELQFPGDLADSAFLLTAGN